MISLSLSQSVHQRTWQAECQPHNSGSIVLLKCESFQRGSHSRIWSVIQCRLTFVEFIASQGCQIARKPWATKRACSVEFIIPLKEIAFLMGCDASKTSF